MNYLLDTQTFIWLDGEFSNLSSHVRSIFAETTNTYYVSVASLWEMQIKTQIGKMALRTTIRQILRDQFELNGIRLLVITADEIWNLGTLPLIHRDPFDRLLIAQARLKQLTIVTADSVFASYPVKVVW